MSSDKLPKGKNPFASVGEWNLANLENVVVEISKPKETTSDFTRSKNKDNRYWKAEVSFSTKDGAYKSRIIKANNCPVPHSDQANYGDSFLMASLPRVIGEKIAAAALQQNIIVDINDKRAVSTANNWWLTINNTRNHLGLVDKDGSFAVKSLDKAFASTEAGMMINFDLVFNLKLTKSDQADRHTNDAFSLVADCSRGAVKAMKQDVEPPQVEGSVPQQPAVRNDIASQELIDAFAEIGL
ncbi:hypothetical protein NHJ13051_008327 [Beauveria bassiana]